MSSAQITDVAQTLLKDLTHHLLDPMEANPPTSTRPDDIMVDVGVYAIYTFLILLVILSLRYGMLNPCARRVVQNKADVGKFGDSGTEFVLYGIFTCVGMACLLPEPWLWTFGGDGWWSGEQYRMTNALRCW